MKSEHSSSEFDIPRITLDDITQLAQRASIHLDDERREILLNMSRLDVRACPGSGKTTLLAAKLALLAEKWTAKNQGICVLSHTNVARKEIQSRFSRFPLLRGLQKYPHFIGTIQSFVDQFLGIQGAILAFRRRPVTIDNDRFRFEACREFFSGHEYETARAALRAYFKTNKYATAEDCIGEIEYCDENLELTPFPSRKTPWGEHTPTVRLLKNLKTKISTFGFFRFKDMDALALHYLKQMPDAISSLRSRFPIVFIDEMQDTPSRHAHLLESIFGEGVIYQRIGDLRQAIYSEAFANSENSVSHFPLPNALTMTKSFRLSPKVCGLVDNLCTGEKEHIEGNHERQDARHTVFLFTRQTIKNVLPVYAELVAEDIGTNLPPELIRAVGAVKKNKEEAVKFPSSIPDYWPEFNPRTRDAANAVVTLGDYTEMALSILCTRNNVRDAMQCFVEAMSRLLRLRCHSNIAIDTRPHALIRSLTEKHPRIATRLRTNLAELCLYLSNTRVIPTIETFNEIQAVANELCPKKWERPALDFWQIPYSVGSPPKSSENSSNVYLHKSGHGNVEILVDTIHSVKGETLRAVLVLDTFQYTQHLRTLLDGGYFFGDRPSKKPGTRVDNHLKRAFVAASRPTDLLCLALCKEHVTESHHKRLAEVGWRIIDV